MTDLAKTLAGLAALAFVLAVVTNYGDYMVEMPVPLPTAEGFSRASSNLALLAIALVLCFREGGSA